MIKTLNKQNKVFIKIFNTKYENTIYKTVISRFLIL